MYNVGMQKTLISMLFVGILLFFGSFSLIETVSAQALNEDISFKVIPRSPSANQRVKVGLVSFNINLNNHFITWYLNGNKQQGNYGMTSFEFVTEELGNDSVVSAVIQVGSQEVIRKKITISPVDITMLWEAQDSYTPPFYKGKALPNRESQIKVVAIPQTKTIKPNDAHDLVYYWKNNQGAQPTSSGYGKSSYVFKKDFIETKNNISVRIEGREGTPNIEGVLTLNEGFLPQILFYLKDPQGRLLLRSALEENDSVKMSPFTISAQPYYFSNDLSSLDFGWKINGETSSIEKTAGLVDITLSNSNSVNVADIFVSIKNPQKLYEQLSSSLIINI